MRTALLALLLLADPASAREESDEFEGRPSILRPGGLLLYQNTKGPFSFSAMTPKDLPREAEVTGEVSARACQHGLAIPVTATLRPATISGARGDGGYEKALAKLAAKNPGLAGIFDVKVDLHTISVLGFYRRLCTEVHALGFKATDTPGPRSSPAPIRR